MVTARKSKPFSETIGILFGGLWGMGGALALPAAWRTPGTILAWGVTAMLVALLWIGRGPVRAGARRFGWKAYSLAVVAELAALFVAQSILSRLGLQAYLMQVAGIIVGLHFIGLWVATGSVRFIQIMVGMCAVSALGMVLPGLVGEVHLRDLVTGIGNALVLWIGARGER